MSEILFPGNQKRAALDRLQSSIAELREEIRAIERAPYAPEDTKAAIHAAVEKACQSGYARRALTSFGRFRVGGRADLPELTWEGLCLLLGRDEVEKRIFKLCAAEPGERGLPLARREQRIADLQAQLDQLEIDEEREVLTLKAEGFRVPRRPDARARLLIDLWQQQAPRASAVA